MGVKTEDGRATRGTTNRNARGGSDSRRRRREWLVATYRADVDVVALDFPLPYALHTDLGQGVPACRCYRCGVLLTVDTVTVDRIKPGCQGGTYRRDNIRPCCAGCNSETGGRTRRK
ncbi:HNH endonuclease [Actinoplanes phage phiAsp2]|uniref:Pas75 n=1 Tax=Actinoplanes phage phiAsp2 TaxID=279303 RepID=Q6J7V6_9CAUD|nr:HNH endonuclease [Actinoplanes phage phiAsp2]AAT36823.1 Pas75 [Actinoplanes phage phiAsp2]